MPDIPPPRIARDITLHLMGDWGVANLHRVCGWIAAEMGRRSGSGSRFATWNGRGGTDAFEAVLSRRVDLALFVPSCFARAALEMPVARAAGDTGSLRAIAVLPQNDALVIAIDARLGIRSLDELRERKPKLRIAVGIDDGVNMVGYATNRLLEMAGMPRAAMEAWGCTFLEGEGPWDVIPLGTSGEADVVIFEAIMTPHWRNLCAKRDMIFLSLDEGLLTKYDSRYGLEPKIVPAGRFKDQTSPLHTVDFSDFLLFARDDLEDDIAQLMAWCLCETRATIEAQYRHLTPENSPLTYPLDPKAMARTPLPLHPGAERHYREAGLL
jgi:TRAP-type uncharacterized transport system substrate-binding protein